MRAVSHAITNPLAMGPTKTRTRELVLWLLSLPLYAVEGAGSDDYLLPELYGSRHEAGRGQTGS